MSKSYQSGHERLNAILNASETRARSIYGDKVVEEALQAAIALDIKEEFVTHPDAYDSLVRWHRNKDDINALMKKGLAQS